MDLLSGSFLWNSDTKIPQGRVELPPSNADIVIVGGGICGAIIANSLSDSGRNIIILDKRDGLAGGSTLASTAILQYELDVSLTELTEKIGKSDALLVYRASFKAWQDLCQLAEQLGEKVEFSRKPSLCLATSQADAEKLNIEADYLNREDFPCEILSQANLDGRFPFSSSAALFHQNAAQVNPVKLTNQLFERAQRKGIKIFNNAHVKELKSSQGSSVTITLKNGTSIRAGRVIIASGYESTEFVKPKKGKLVSSYAAATSICEESDLWDTEAVIWETARPYHYLRVAPGPRIIIGGGDMSFRNPFLRDILLPLKSFHLVRKLRDLLNNDSLKFDYCWSGTFGESDDAMPFLGEIESLPGVYFVIGCGGNGITFSMLATDLIAKWLANKRDSLSRVFALDR